jgi:hypothetical protein
MARRRGKSSDSIGRNFYETTSPFEGSASNKSLAATSSEVNSLWPAKNWPAHFSPSFDAKHFVNPPDMPGVALVQKGDEKPKLPWKWGK